MPKQPYDEIDLNFLRTCLREAGQIALAQRGQMVAEMKSDFTPVTAVDRQVEDFLMRRIAERYPGHYVLSEESGLHSTGSDFAWIIDPIDGTRAFASGLPIWGISMGVFYQGRPAVGGFYLPVSREMYWGTTEQAYYNQQELRPLPGADLSSPLVFLAVPSNFHLHFEISYPRIRSLGSTAAHLSYVATGAAVGALTRHVSLWDLAGILPILSAVGVQIGYLSGEAFEPADLMDGRPIHEPLLAAHPQVFELLRHDIQPV